ncbi:hypothetical protein IEQ34_007061 [Dendrobium chrysotoxum]|uniref:Uncharacterized protein n=1 Tax=Dendrobium chrysotoxum TaxID=161865 RepID=A0AAV7H8A1_DENCH|nr:hypothetical protein IEQ34_007061 [Dendrobium chrysotoxum]
MSRTGRIVQSFELFVQYDFLGDFCKSIVRKDSGSLPHLESEKDDGSLPHLESEKDDGSLPHLESEKDDGSLPHLEGEKDDGSLPHLEGEKDDGTLPHRGWWKRICKGFSALLWGQKESHLFILVVVEFLFQKKEQKLSLFVLYEERLCETFQIMIRTYVSKEADAGQIHKTSTRRQISDAIQSNLQSYPDMYSNYLQHLKDAIRQPLVSLGIKDYVVLVERASRVEIDFLNHSKVKRSA